MFWGIFPNLCLAINAWLSSTTTCTSNIPKLGIIQYVPTLVLRFGNLRHSRISQSWEYRHNNMLLHQSQDFLASQAPGT